jgi:AAA domain
MAASLSAIVYGDSGAGKSSVAQTMPKPRLILDAEGGSKYARCHGRKVAKIYWNPETEEIPEDDGTWETCVVVCRKFGTMRLVFTALNEQPHPFKSLGLDSLTEIQKRCKDAIMASDDRTSEGKLTHMAERQWGLLLGAMENLVRSLRDLTMHPKYPLDVVLILALMASKEHEKNKPAVQGALGVSLPGYVDVVGYLGTLEDEETGEIERRLLIQPHKDYQAKDRTFVLTEHYGNVIADPDFTAMLNVLQEEA